MSISRKPAGAAGIVFSILIISVLGTSNADAHYTRTDELGVSVRCWCSDA